jgi:hypothetical protein
MYGDVCRFRFVDEVLWLAGFVGSALGYKVAKTPPERAKAHPLF